MKAKQEEFIEQEKKRTVSKARVLRAAPGPARAGGGGGGPRRASAPSSSRRPASPSSGRRRFTVSAAQRAMPDVNLLTMTETLETARHINNAVGIPVIADCDNGYGNAVNVVRTVEEYERAGIAGLCIEDNVFPKKCSLYPGDAPGAGCRSRSTPARSAPPSGPSATRPPWSSPGPRRSSPGWGMKEALRRAHAYAEAGADMILMHSKAPTAAEVLEFMRLLGPPDPDRGGAHPLPRRSTWEELEGAGVKLVICANQVLRSAGAGMRDGAGRARPRAAARRPRLPTSCRWRRSTGWWAWTSSSASRPSSLPRGASDVRAVIIAAGSGKSLLPLTEDRPKCMLDIKGRTLLERQLETLAGLRHPGHHGGARLSEGSGHGGRRTLLRQRRLRGDRRAALPVRRGARAARPACCSSTPTSCSSAPLLERLLRAEGDVVDRRGPRVGGPARPSAAARASLSTSW